MPCFGHQKINIYGVPAHHVKVRACRGGFFAIFSDSHECETLIQKATWSDDGFQDFRHDHDVLWNVLFGDVRVR